MDLSIIEKKIGEIYGLTIFDYLFIFNKKAILPKDISIGGKDKLLLEYINSVNSFFKETQQPEIPIKPEQIEDSFYEVMHNLYIFRYMLGIKLFADYEMVRIETWFENKMINMPQNNFLESVPETFGLKISESLLIDPLGNFDEFASQSNEEKTSTIKSYISSVAFGSLKAELLYSMFRNYTSKEFVPRFLEKEITELCKELMTQIGIFISKKVYEFLNQKFTLIEAKNSVLNLISKQLLADEYYSDMEIFKKDFFETIKLRFKTNDVINTETLLVISNEFWDLFRINFNSLIFFPENYYKIDFRKADNSRESEESFSNIIDLTLLENDGTPWDMPVETYAVEFTEDAKKNIFETVTNGFENPNFTFKDYLFLYK